MNAPDRNIHPLPDRPQIRQLDEGAINRIAAGEVVERPASAVKELVENALDAGARRIAVEIAGGGKVLIRVTDDGCGMSASDLPLALARHATSKIDGSDLLDIRSFGFRGEALPSLGAVGRLTITSRAKSGDHKSNLDTDRSGAAAAESTTFPTSVPESRSLPEGAAQIRCEGGHLSEVTPAALRAGTVVELRDLFYATPARLKFLRTDRAETQAIAEVIRRLALAEPFVSFTLTDLSDGQRRELLRTDAAQGELWGALEARVTAILGRDFTENSLRIDLERDGLGLSGLAGLPTYSRGVAAQQYLFVNGRPVRDRLLFGALQAAYSDVLPRGRYPAAVLFLDCDPHLVDVNVHPAKSEVRFRDPALARGLIVGGLRQALAAAGHRASSTVAGETLRAFRSEGTGAGSGSAGTSDAGESADFAADRDSRPAPRIYQMDFASRPSRAATGAAVAWQSPISGGFADAAAAFPGAHTSPGSNGQDGDVADRSHASADEAVTSAADAPFGHNTADSAGFSQAFSARVEPGQDPAATQFPLGAARAQLHQNWIIAQTATGIVIVDQHAAHERLTYERLKRQHAGHGIAAQTLLIPEILEPGALAAAQLLAAAPELAALGLEIEAFGPGAVAIRSVPAILGQPDIKSLIEDILDELDDTADAGGDSGALRARIDAILSRMACHGSIRSGRQMRAEEMNALLREMEVTPNSGQCNHGRPTWVELKLSDIERLFGRS